MRGRSEMGQKSGAVFAPRTSPSRKLGSPSSSKSIERSSPWVLAKLFLSRRSHFAPGKAIRGVVPICFP